MERIKIAVQLYSVRDDCEKDLSKTLEGVAKMGYEGVEFAGYYERSAAELKKMVDDLGLAVAGTHIGLDTLLGDELEKTIAFNKELGNKFLICPGLPEERRNSIEAWLKTAEIMNDISDKLAPHGMRTGYHNHTVEFTPMDGKVPWDEFFSATKPEVVMQFDTGNALHGGAESVPILERFPGRAGTIHLKEYSSTNDKALVGEGDIPWADVFRLCEATPGTEWYIVEQESYTDSLSPMDCIDKCLQNLKAMGK